MSSVRSARLRRCLMQALAAMAIGTLAAASADSVPAFHDPLDTPALLLQGAAPASAEPLIAISTTHARTIAVGLRGIAIYSDTDGRWRQADVPVQSDLVAVQMLDGTQAWAAGHDAVILRSDDGGASWRKAFDRTASKQTLAAYYEKRVAAGETAMQTYLKQVRLNTDGDVSLPYLGIWFDDRNVGFAVGSFGMIIATRDGGKTWTPWLDRIDNDDFLNLNNIRGIDGEVYVVGERGRVYHLDRQQQRFAAAETGYKGTFFDIVGTRRALIAFGLRGAAYRSIDGGVSWHAAKTGVERAITAGAVFDGGRRIVLFTETGQAIQSTDDGQSFRPLQLPDALPVYAAGADPRGRVVLAGYAGVQVHPLP